MRHYPPLTQPAGNTSWNGQRDRGEQRRFRTMILKRDGHICQRCGRTDVPLQAHHVTQADGIMLCQPCHRHEDPHAR